MAFLTPSYHNFLYFYCDMSINFINLSPSLECLKCRSILATRLPCHCSVVHAMAAKTIDHRFKSIIACCEALCTPLTSPCKLSKDDFPKNEQEISEMKDVLYKQIVGYYLGHYNIICNPLFPSISLTLSLLFFLSLFPFFS